MAQEKLASEVYTVLSRRGGGSVTSSPLPSIRCTQQSSQFQQGSERVQPLQKQPHRPHPNEPHNLNLLNEAVDARLIGGSADPRSRRMGSIE